jgi:hypothetical protein
MRTTLISTLFSAALAAFAVACSDDASTTDASTTDASGAFDAAAATDATVPRDTGTRADAAPTEPDAGGAPDASSEDAVAADVDEIPADSGVITADASVSGDAGSALCATDAGPFMRTDGGVACSYLDDPIIVACAPRFEYARVWTDTSNPAACPPYTTFRSNTYADPIEATCAQGCNPACIYRATLSVSFLFCGRRSGYIVYRAANCADVYEFAEGLYPSVEAHAEANPCPM